MDVSNKVLVFDVNGDIYVGWYMIIFFIKFFGFNCI